MSAPETPTVPELVVAEAPVKVTVPMFAKGANDVEPSLYTYEKSSTIPKKIESASRSRNFGFDIQEGISHTQY
jgi:hypothetical protein